MPANANTPRTAHSLTEAHLFLTATPCLTCAKGPLRVKDDAPPSSGSKEDLITLLAECVSCRRQTTWSFLVDSSSKEGVINATPEPSRILDVAQWIMLSGMIAATASTELDKQKKRRLLIEAAQCLDEALKFYTDDNDLPPSGAFLHEGSKQRFQRNPEQFSRQRLIHLRSKLPKVQDSFGS